MAAETTDSLLPEGVKKKIADLLLEELDIPKMAKRITPAVEAEYKRAIVRAIHNMANDLDVACFLDRAAEKELAAMLARAFKKMK